MRATRSAAAAALVSAALPTGPIAASAPAANGGRKLGLRRQLEPVLGDHCADRLAIAHAAPGPDGEGEVEVGARFLPDAELPFRDVALHVLPGAALKGEFPIMDHAGPIGREVAHPAAFHEQREDARESVLDGVGSEGQDDRRAPYARRPNLRGRLTRHRPAPQGRDRARRNRGPPCPFRGRACSSFQRGGGTRSARGRSMVSCLGLHPEVKGREELLGPRRPCRCKLPHRDGCDEVANERGLHEARSRSRERERHPR